MFYFFLCGFIDISRINQKFCFVHLKTWLSISLFSLPASFHKTFSFKRKLFIFSNLVRYHLESNSKKKNNFSFIKSNKRFFFPFTYFSIKSEFCPWYLSCQSYTVLLSFCYSSSSRVSPFCFVFLIYIISTSFFFILNLYKHIFLNNKV